ncbi:hypothetical protein B0H13DRAFT_2031812, partial [Mycena leptocephala]
MSQKSPQGLLVTKEPQGLYVEEADLNDWYDNEHAPLKLTVPGVKSAVRYKAVDSQTPTWLTLYDIETPEVANSEPYNAIGGLSRRTYAHMGTFTHPETTAKSMPCKYILAVTLEMMTPEAEDDLDKWYDEEHMDSFLKYLVEYGQKGELMVDKPVSKYLAIHEFLENNFLDSPEFKHATSTEWRDRARVFELTYRKRDECNNYVTTVQVFLSRASNI